MTKGLCHKTGGPEDPDVYAFTYPLVLPLSVLLCCYFLYKLYETKSTTLAFTTAVYVIVALCLELSHSWLYFVRPLTRVSTPLAFCATVEFSGWMLIAASYVSLQQVLLHRLKVVFATSVFEVKRSVIAVWNVFHAFVLTVAILVFASNSSTMDCKRKIELSGLSVAIGFFPKYIDVCAANRDRIYDVSFYGVIFTGVCVMVGNALLGWMYVTRMRGILGGHSTADERILSVVRKASVIALASITTTFLSLLGATFGKLFTYMDTLLNVYFLFCQFTFAKGFYNATLAYCEPLVNRLMRSKKQPVKYDMCAPLNTDLKVQSPTNAYSLL